MTERMPYTRRALLAHSSHEQRGMPAALRNSCNYARWPGAQRGVALVVALILLVVITLIGLAAVSGTIMQSKMAANQYDRQTAFQNAASGLRVAKQVAQTWINAHPGASLPAALPAGWRNCSTLGNVCLSNPFSDPNVRAANIFPVPSGSAAGEYTAAPLATGQPEYVIEYMGRCWRNPDNPVIQNTAGEKNKPSPSTGPKNATYYRITSRSGDPADVGDRAVVTLQEVVEKPTDVECP